MILSPVINRVPVERLRCLFSMNKNRKRLIFIHSTARPARSLRAWGGGRLAAPCTKTGLSHGGGAPGTGSAPGLGSEWVQGSSPDPSCTLCVPTSLRVRAAVGCGRPSFSSSWACSVTGIVLPGLDSILPPLQAQGYCPMQEASWALLSMGRHARQGRATEAEQASFWGCSGL